MVDSAENSRRLPVIDLGRMAYAPAYAEQVRRVEEVLAARDSGSPLLGVVLLVEHDPVVTVSRRPSAREHLIASPELLAHHGVAVEETDRGGDITYHGPGQLVVYPILDLNRLNLGVHAHMRLLEQAVIDVCGEFGVTAVRDPAATGVWVQGGASRVGSPSPTSAKICAMGVRVRRWVTMHGLAINVTTDLSHFGLIVPCGLVGRPVTSLERELGARCPSMQHVKALLSGRLTGLVMESAIRAELAREKA